MGCEDDSFGPVGRFVMCEPCYKAKHDEDEEMTFCHDCKKTEKAKETIKWRWYDFYAEQGDEALVICRECWKAPRHQDRMANDRAERDEEDGYDEY